MADRGERKQPEPCSQSFSDEERAWCCLQALAQRAARGRPLSYATCMDVDESGEVHESRGALEQSFVRVGVGIPHGFESARPLTAAAAALLRQFLPLVVGRDSAQLVVAHLGQSADGYAATFCGRTKFITGEDDLRHTHRMRALFDAVLVGASTVAIDDPLLTTRMVSGPSPVRVVLDPCARLRSDHQVFHERGARTLVVSEPGRSSSLPAHVELMQIRRAGGGLDLEQLISALRERGLSRVFIEGGALTIAHFVRAKLLHRLQLAVAPVRLGPGPALPSHALSPSALSALGRTRRWRLGRDTLFEAELRERARFLQPAPRARA